MKHHTPGPWKAHKGIDGDPTRCYVTQAIQGEREWQIAVIENGAPGDCLETEFANALLIAAAPDLLEVVHCLLVAREHETGNTICDENSPLIDAARVAFKKATSK